MSDGTSPAAPWREVFRGRDGRLVIGLLLFETLGAVHILIVATVMPAVLRDLGDLPLYGWAFASAALAMIAAIPIVGAAMERFGTRSLIAATAVLYVLGLVGAALAPTMLVLVLARFVQGAASGSAYALSLGTVAKTLPPAIRPRVLALLATSWLLPALLGPAVGGLLADSVGWRWAFVVPIPILAVSVAMIWPAVTSAVDPEADRLPIARSLWLMAGTGLFLGGINGGSFTSAALTVTGLIVALVALVRIVPSGTLRALPVVPAASLCAFLLSLGFAAIDSYIPLMLTNVRGLSVQAASLTIMVGAVTWAIGSWWQSHVAGRITPGALVTVGAVCFVVGIAIATFVLHGAFVWLILAAWAAAGFGMGTAFPTIPLAVMAVATEGAEARELSPTLLMDTLGIAIGAGLGGAAIARLEAAGYALTAGLSVAFGLAAVAAVMLALLARRMDPRA
jgi:MFS family permease